MNHFIKQHTLVFLSILTIFLGGLFIFYSRFLDGTLVNKVVDYNQPKLTEVLDSQFFSPLPIGSVVGIFSVQTDKSSYSPGDNIYVYISFCKYKDSTPTIRWQLIDGSIIDFGYRKGQIFAPGCYKNLKVLVDTVPQREFSETDYSAHGIIVHQANPFRKVSYLLISNNFTINNK